MEIEYSTYDIKNSIYGNCELVGLYDITGDFVYNNFYDIRNVSYSKKKTANMYLKFMQNVSNKKLIDTLISDLGIEKNILKTTMGNLSSSELIKILLIKTLTSDAKVIILKYIDIYLNYKDFKIIMQTIKNHLAEIDKHVILVTNNADLLIEQCNRFIVAENKQIIYNGKDIKEFPIKTSIAKFVDTANEKKAKLDYYKSADDLLKAIYRSVKR